MSRLPFLQTLELPPSATEAEIKAARKKLALKYHPDKHQDPEEKQKAQAKYLQIEAAYEALTRSDKGSARTQDDILDDLWKGAGGAGSSGAPPRRRECDCLDCVRAIDNELPAWLDRPLLAVRLVLKLDFELLLTLPEFYNGVTKYVVICNRCLGTKMYIAAKCQQCLARGYLLLSPGDLPAIKLEIARGTRPGNTLSVGGSIREALGKILVFHLIETSEQVPTDTLPDVEVEQKVARIEVSEGKGGGGGGFGALTTPMFKRRSDFYDSENAQGKYNTAFDLVITHKLTVAEVLGDWVYRFNHMDDRIVEIRGPADYVCKAPCWLVVEGEGMHLPSGLGKGNLWVNITEITFPTKIEKEQRDKIRLLFPDVPVASSSLPPDHHLAQLPPPSHSSYHPPAAHPAVSPPFAPTPIYPAQAIYSSQFFEPEGGSQSSEPPPPASESAKGPEKEDCCIS